MRANGNTPKKTPSRNYETKVLLKTNSTQKQKLREEKLKEEEEEAKRAVKKHAAKKIYSPLMTMIWKIRSL